MISFSRSGMIVDIINRKIFPGTVEVEEGRISAIKEDSEPKSDFYILPGFIDSHIHIESSMLVPSEFARLAAVHGTVATVSDPHEIGNVLGIEGIRFMIRNGEKVPFHFYFGVPSCVPATLFETAGAVISAQDIETLFIEDKLKYLSEMMNYPGVLGKDPEVMRKLNVAKKLGKPIDGHAPGLRGSEAEQYIAAGISTDHECFTLDEALDKIKYGMKILIREGSAAKNYAALHTLIKLHPDKVMFCSDDKHPHELVDGHINDIVRRSIVEHGYDTMDVLRAATLNPITHYGLEVGLLRKGDSADFIIVNNLQDFDVIENHVKGKMIAIEGEPLIPHIEAEIINRFASELKKPDDFHIKATGGKCHVIVAKDGQLTTDDAILDAKVMNNSLVSDTQNDILKLTVVNRYQNEKPAVAFIRNFGLRRGALASCIAHDSHNIIAVGCSDDELCTAVNLLMKNKGGIALVDGKEQHILPLPIGGIMSNEDGYMVAQKYAEMDALAKGLGTKLYAPFMTLSFMALLVIPSLKLSNKGLFDGSHFKLIDLQDKQ